MDVVAHNAAISKCVKGKAWQQAGQHFQQLRQRRLEGNDITQSTLLNALSKSVQWALSVKTLQTFYNMHFQPNVITHGAALNAFSEAWPQGLRLLSLFLEQSSEVNAFTYSTSITSIPLDHWTCALELLMELQWQTQANLVSYNAALAALADMAESSLSESISILEVPRVWAQSLGIFEAQQSRSLQPDVISFGTALRCGPWSWALQLLRQMKEEVLRPSLIAYLAVTKDWGLSLQNLKDQGTEPNLQIYSSTLSAAPWPEAHQLFSEVVQSADLVAFGAVMNDGYWSQILQLLSDALGRRFSAVSLYVCSISACERCSQWEVAILLLETFCSQALEGDVSAQNAAISACGKAAQWQHALEILWKIPETCLQINQISLNASISACEKSAMWERALDLYNWMCWHSLEPDGITCNALISSFEKSLLWDWALYFFYAFLEQRSLSEVAYKAVLSACEKSGQWQAVICLLIDMRRTTTQAMFDLPAPDFIFKKKNRLCGWLTLDLEPARS